MPFFWPLLFFLILFFLAGTNNHYWRVPLFTCFASFSYYIIIILFQRKNCGLASLSYTSLLSRSWCGTRWANVSEVSCPRTQQQTEMNCQPFGYWTSCCVVWATIWTKMKICKQSWKFGWADKWALGRISSQVGWSNVENKTNVSSWWRLSLGSLKESQKTWGLWMVLPNSVENAATECRLEWNYSFSCSL